MGGRTNPRAVTPNNDPALHGAGCGCSGCAPGGLVEELGAVADDMRSLYAEFGLRPYRVFSVVVRWTGGASGRGNAVVESETELLPVPLVVTMDGVRGVSTPAGRNEKGSIELRQVSPRYTEDDIRSLFHIQPLPVDHDGFLEVRVDGRDGAAVRRRFTVRGTPHRDAAGFQWRVRLQKQDADRSRAGAIQDDVSTPAEVQMARFGEP